MRKRRPQIGRQLVDKFADGKWHPIETIAKVLKVEVQHAAETLRVMHVHETYGHHCERKKVGTTIHWRIYPRVKTVSADELAAKLGPIAKDLKVEGQKNMATASPGTVAYLAHQLQRLIDEWTK